MDLSSEFISTDLADRISAQDLTPAALRLTNAVDAVDLGRDIRIEGLPTDEAELVMNACTPRGHHFYPVRQFGQRYALVRPVSAAQWEDHQFRWDQDGVMGDALVLSRLIRDNGHSLQYAARIADYEDGQQMVIYTPGAEGKAVYRLRRDRDWLDAGEAHALRELLSAFWEAESGLPPRVQRATFRTEYACWSGYGDQMLPMIVSGLEALLKVGRDGLTRQFAQRATALADELSIDGVTEDFCAEMYDARSDWVHGAHVRLFTTRGEGPETAEQWRVLGEIAKLQDLLRAAVRRCLEEPAFREIFTSDEAISEHWPIRDT
jgi:hypothetical protein